jgi:hypothetical protein
MNDKELEGRLVRLARSDDNISSPESLRRFGRGLMSGAAQPAARDWPLKWAMPGLTAARAIGSLAVTAVIAGALLVAVVPKHPALKEVGTPAPEPTFAASSWTKLHSFASDSGWARASAMHLDGGLIYGLIQGDGAEQHSDRWGTFQTAQVSVANSLDGRVWTLGNPLSDPVLTRNLPPMDASTDYNDVIKRGSRWVVVGGIVGAPAAVAIGDGNQPVQSIGMAWVSDDGITWSQPAGAQFPGYELNSVRATESGFVVTGIRSGGGTGIWTSSDGATWRAAPLPAAPASVSIELAVDPAGGYLALVTSGDWTKGPQTLSMLHSVDGREWTPATTKIQVALEADHSIAYENGTWMISLVEADQKIGDTADGLTTWQAHLQRVVSQDGVTWTTPDPSAEFTWVSPRYTTRVKHGSDTIGFASAWAPATPIAAGATPVPAATVMVVPGAATPVPSPTAGAPVPSAPPMTLGRTVDQTSWVSAGTGPAGIPTDALALPDRVLVFLYQNNLAGDVLWVEVWSAPWP